MATLVTPEEWEVLRYCDPFLLGGPKEQAPAVIREEQLTLARRKLAHQAWRRKKRAERMMSKQLKEEFRKVEADLRRRGEPPIEYAQWARERKRALKGLPAEGDDSGDEADEAAEVVDEKAVEAVVARGDLSDSSTTHTSDSEDDESDEPS
jgi:hypothetical protein